MSITNKKAFTLIELLVVVLIIGILAAIALPKYQFAVMKARASEAFILGKAAYNAQENYKLIHDTWATSADMLDISFPSASFNNDNGYLNIVMENFDISMRLDSQTINVRSYAGRTPQSIDYQILFRKDHRIVCRAGNRRGSLEKAEKLCIALGGKNRTVIHENAVDFYL